MPSDHPKPPYPWTWPNERETGHQVSDLQGIQIINARRKLDALSEEMAAQILFVTAAETGEDLGYRAESLDGLRDKLKAIIKEYPRV